MILRCTDGVHKIDQAARQFPAALPGGHVVRDHLVKLQLRLREEGDSLVPDLDIALHRRAQTHTAGIQADDVKPFKDRGRNTAVDTGPCPASLATWPAGVDKQVADSVCFVSGFSARHAQLDSLVSFRMVPIQGDFVRSTCDIAEEAQIRRTRTPGYSVGVVPGLMNAAGLRGPIWRCVAHGGQSQEHSWQKICIDHGFVSLEIKERLFKGVTVNNKEQLGDEAWFK